MIGNVGEPYIIPGEVFKPAAIMPIPWFYWAQIYRIDDTVAYGDYPLSGRKQSLPGSF